MAVPKSKISNSKRGMRRAHLKLNKITELWKLKREYNTLYVQINLFILCFPPSFPGEWRVSDCEELVGVTQTRRKKMY